jgi:hypothetical protein
LPEDFKMKYRVSYELMSTDEAAKDLAALREGKDGDVIFDAVMEVFRKKGIMLGEAFDEREKGQSKDTYHMTLRLNTEHAFVSAHDVLEYIEAQINAREDVEDLRDTERAVAYVRELMGGEDLEPLEATEILEVGDLLVWRQLKLDLAKLSWHKPRSELRNNEGDEQVDAPPIIEKSREEIQAKPETIAELIEALKDDEMMLWAAEQLDTKDLDDDVKMTGLKNPFQRTKYSGTAQDCASCESCFQNCAIEAPSRSLLF